MVQCTLLFQNNRQSESMKNTFLFESNIKTKQQFIKKCAEMQCKNMLELADNIGQSRSNLYALINYFELSKEERRSMLKKENFGDHNEINPYEAAPDDLPKGGKFHLFNYCGAYFQVYKVDTTNEIYVLRYRKGKLGYASELLRDGELMYYFVDANGKRKYVKKTVFMYCFHYKLQSLPSGKRVKMIDPNGSWCSKPNLVAVDISPSKKTAHHKAMCRAKIMLKNGEKYEALKHLQELLEAEIEAESKGVKD